MTPHSRHLPPERQPNAVALDAAGGWWNVAGDRYLELDWEGRRATLWDYSDSESGVESAGTWRATDQTIVVEVSGAAGSLTREYEVVGNDAELFLAPAPVSTAKLLDSWIADHGNQDDEDVGPGHSVSREAVWRPHHGAGHPRLHLHHSRRGHALWTRRLREDRSPYCEGREMRPCPPTRGSGVRESEKRCHV